MLIKVVANLPCKDSYEKLKKNIFKLKILIVKGVFGSLKAGELIKNVSEPLRTLLHVEMAP